MYQLRVLLCLGSLLLPLTALAAEPSCGGADCCGKMGGIQYCDSSAGRYVCQNGRYSSCYCTRHAVMDMQAFAGCCVWQGGVFKIDELGLVICNNGGVSETCSLWRPVESIASW
jgi:hypothetical protein